MANISARQRPAEITLDNAALNVDIAAYTTGTMGETAAAVEAGTYNLPAGQYSVEIYNDGLQDITANSQTIPTGNTYRIEAVSNPNTQKLDLTPAITLVVPAGGKASYIYYTPSA